MNRKHWLVLVAAGALAALAGTAWATGAVTSIVAPDGTINGCYRANGQDDDEGQKGQLRVVAAGKQCKKNELAIQWSQQGPKGDTGAQGVAGQAGLKGDSGAPGAAGAKGDTGTAGATGPAGLQGAKGDPGASGAAGAKGDTGTAGATGLAGSQGPKGDSGDTGAGGAAGADGAPGATGASGPKGDQGAGVVWRGDWQTGPGSPAYGVGDLVRHGGAIWIARQATGGGCRFQGGVITCPSPPGTDDSVWQLFAQDGSTGATGATGAQGPSGLEGPKGDRGDPGAQGPQGPAAPRVAGGYEWVDGPEVTIGFGQTRSSVAACSSAFKKVVGGGYTMSGNMDVLTNRASSHQGWRVEAQNLDVLNAYTLRAFAICVNATHLD